MKYLNLGCGTRFNDAWTNIDRTSGARGVEAFDLDQGIPFPETSFDVVYHSHLLEHFSRKRALPFLRECYRVLRPGGVIRVAVPDLEKIVRAYLAITERADEPPETWASDYEWIMLEMYDQTVRTYSGGDMAEYLGRDRIPNEEFIVERCGSEAKAIIAAGRRSRSPQAGAKRRNGLSRLYIILRSPSILRESLIKLLLGKEYGALQTGRFREKGEVHRWMYDRHSLAMLLGACGFKQIVTRGAAESYVPDWAEFGLDTEPDGSVYKPDSLFMEAIRPT
jgi:predicted SAM-dependent methyltransferase